LAQVAGLLSVRGMTTQKKNMMNSSAKGQKQYQRRQGNDANGMKWKKSFTSPSVSAALSTKKLKPVRARGHSVPSSRASATRKYVKASPNLSVIRAARLTLPAPTQVKGAWALKATPFESFSPFDSRFPKMQVKKRREPSAGFLTLSPFDSRFPSFSESYCPWDVRFPHGPAPKFFPSFSPFDPRFPINGVMSGLSREDLATNCSAKVIDEERLLTTVPTNPSVVLPIPIFSPTTRTSTPEATRSRGFFGWLAGGVSPPAPSPLSSVLQRFAGFGSPTISQNYQGPAHH